MRNVILNQLIPGTSPTWFDQVETIYDAKTLPTHDTAGYLMIADTDSIGPIDKRARKVHDEYTKDAQAPDEDYYPGNVYDTTEGSYMGKSEDEGNLIRTTPTPH